MACPFTVGGYRGIQRSHCLWRMCTPHWDRTKNDTYCRPPLGGGLLSCLGGLGFEFA